MQKRRWYWEKGERIKSIERGEGKHESYLSPSPSLYPLWTNIYQIPWLISPGSVRYSEWVEFQFVNEVVDKWPDLWHWWSTTKCIAFCDENSKEKFRLRLRDVHYTYIIIITCIFEVSSFSIYIYIYISFP